MLIEHLGEMVDISPQQATLEKAILRVLKKRGPVRQRNLWFHIGARGHGIKTMLDPVYLSAIERLVQKRLILRSVQRRNSFLLRIPPRSMRERLAAEAQAELLQRKGEAA